MEDPDILHDVEEKSLVTPFGKPSDALKIGNIKGIPCALLSRHGRKHDISPTQVNYRANIWALKEVGCTHILVSTCCGSLKEEIKPGELVIVDQFIDRTTKRDVTFFDGTPGGPDYVCHIPMGHPFCERMRKILIAGAKNLQLPHHESGTTVCIEGPRFSTKAESFLYRQWGAHLVNMTTVPEVTLAKELGLCYAAIALPTDYDCWHNEEESVSVELVLRRLKENGEKASNLILHAVEAISREDWTDYIAELQKLAHTSVMA